MRKRLPEIFIVGVMKGGTTILHDYICTHPQVHPGRAQGNSLLLAAVEPSDRLVRRPISLATRVDAVDQLPDRPRSRRYADDTGGHQARFHRIILIVRDPVARAILGTFSTFARSLTKMCSPASTSMSSSAGRSIVASVRSTRRIICCGRFWSSASTVRNTGTTNIFSVGETSSCSPTSSCATIPRERCGGYSNTAVSNGRPRKCSGARTMPGSHELPVRAEVRERLSSLMYPGYRQFLEQSGSGRRSRGPVDGAGSRDAGHLRLRFHLGGR